MKRTTLLLVLIGISIQITQAQVKEQYRDQDNAETVVVVKEDGADNIDILNSQFDLAEVSMGEEIMIIMKDGKPVMVKSDGTPVNINNDASPAEPADDVFANAEMPVAETPKRVVKSVDETPAIQEEIAEAAPVVQKVVKPAAKATTVRSNASTTRAKSAPGTYPVKTKFKKKKVSRKAYKKRKSFSLFGKKGSSCYRF